MGLFFIIIVCLYMNWVHILENCRNQMMTNQLTENILHYEHDHCRCVFFMKGFCFMVVFLSLVVPRVLDTSEFFLLFMQIEFLQEIRYSRYIGRW